MRLDNGHPRFGREGFHLLIWRTSEFLSKDGGQQVQLELNVRLQLRQSHMVVAT